MLDPKALGELADDIAEHGLRQPIILLDGQILDGRNRYEASVMAGVEPRVETFNGDDPLTYVVSANLKRRHLDESQRAMVAARLATLHDGQRQVGQLADVPTQERASEMLNVGERSVRRARKVIEDGAPELVEAVERGEVSVSAAAVVASEPVQEQKEIVANGPAAVVTAAKAKRLNARQAEAKVSAPAEDDDEPTKPANPKRQRPKSRAQRWEAEIGEARTKLSEIESLIGDLESALSEARSIQEEYESWGDNLPENMASSSTAEMLETVCNLELEGAAEQIKSAASELSDLLTDAEGVDLPQGFGRD